MIDTYEAEKRLYSEITTTVILGMYSIQNPIENLKTAEEIKKYQEDAIDYYNGRWNGRHDFSEGVLMASHEAVMFSAKVNQTVARIMMEVQNVFEAIKEWELREIAIHKATTKRVT
jgi:hypothetical protein